MLLPPLVTLLAAITTQVQGVSDHSPLSPSSSFFSSSSALAYRSPLEACKAAPNCEVHKTAHGPSIRFSPRAYHEYHDNSRRQHAKDISKRTTTGSNATWIMYGDTSINYGRTGASGPDGAIARISELCSNTTCSTAKTLSIESMYAGPGMPKFNISLSARGWYGNDSSNGNSNSNSSSSSSSETRDQRRALLDVLVAAAAQNEVCRQVAWATSIGSSYPIRQCVQSNYISVVRFRDGVLSGYIEARTQAAAVAARPMPFSLNATALDGPELGWCAKITPQFALAANALAAVASASVLGSGFFGSVRLVCV